MKTQKLKISKFSPKVRAKMAQGLGKLRRFALTTIQEEYIARMQKLRQGACKRCGLCCKLFFECPFLQNLADGSSRCRIHGRKPDNCSFFPIDERDLQDRDSLGAQVPCGFSFRKARDARQAQANWF